MPTTDKPTNHSPLPTVAESGLCRLRGHKGPITELLLLGSEQFLVSASKDTHVKVWDLRTQHCVHTLAGQRAEVGGSGHSGCGKGVPVVWVAGGVLLH